MQQGVTEFHKITGTVQIIFALSVLTQFWILEIHQKIRSFNPELGYVSVGHLLFHSLKIVICPMLLYSTNWEFPESFSRKYFYPENLWFWQHIPAPFILVPIHQSPLASPHTAYKEAGLSIQTHNLSCFLSSLVMRFLALL